MRASVRGLALVLASALVAAGCGGPAVDLTKALQVNVIATGWFDAGIINGQNKLVPEITFTLKNVSDRKLVSLMVMASFFRANNTSSEWGNALLTVTGSEGLAPGATSAKLTMKSPLGYTSEDARADMLKNSQFVDAVVKLVSKYGANQWTHIFEAPIARTLITQ
jgi:hypothetical protein